MLTTRVQTIILHNDLVASGDKWLVAVSGGIDSLALMHILYTLHGRLGLNLHVATFDHGLRGAAGAADARFVVTNAASLKLPVTTDYDDVRARAAESGMGIEAAARRARYDFLARVAQETGATAVVTAHHADDQAETVLMHILRGSGLDGLRGMALASTVPGHPDVRLLRPLLTIRRAELADYCTENDLHPREDATNTDTKHLRNRIRHAILPALRAINPQVDAALNRLAESADLDAAYLEEQAREIAGKLVTQTSERVYVDRRGFAGLHPALQHRVIRQAVAGITSESPAYEHVLDAVRLGSTGEPGAIVHFPGGVQVRVDYDRLCIEATDAAPPLPDRWPLLQPEQQINVTFPGETLIPGMNWSLVVGEAPGQGADSVTLHIPMDASIVLRTRRPGERFRPCGMNGHSRSIKKWMIDRKISRHLRDRIPILDVNGEVAAILTANQWQIGEKFAKTGKKLIKIYLFVNYS